MKKTIKGLSIGLISFLLCVGTIYAAYLVLGHKMSTTVKEPITVTTGVEYGQAGNLPGTMYPNQTYNFSFCVKNADNVVAPGNGTQKLGVIVKNSTNLSRVSLTNFDGTIPFAWNTLFKFDLVQGTENCIKGTVKTPSDMTPGDAWVNIDVTRE